MKRVALLTLPLALAACEQQAADAPAEQGGAASGEVLEGSVSDAMIPLDQLKSEAPLAPRQAQGDTSPSLDAEQPVVDPALGPDGAAPASEGAGTAPAAPTPQSQPAG
jgi:hypothetical protein